MALCNRPCPDQIFYAYYSQYLPRSEPMLKMRWARQVARMGEMKISYTTFTEKLQVKRALGRPKRRWEGNIILDLREAG
jgi:hypothetical protein